MLTFSRDTNVVANLALINPDIFCKGEIEAVFIVWMSLGDLDF